MSLRILLKLVFVGSAFTCFFIGGLSFTVSPHVSAANVVTAKEWSKYLLKNDLELAAFIAKSKLAFQQADREKIEALFNLKGLDAAYTSAMREKINNMLETPHLDRIDNYIEQIEDYDTAVTIDVSQITEDAIQRGTVAPPLNMAPAYLLNVIIEEQGPDSMTSYQQLIGRTSAGEYKFINYVPLSACKERAAAGPVQCAFY